MIVRCIKIISPVTLQVVGAHPSIEVGYHYRVLSMEVNPQRGLSFRILGREWHAPALWDSRMFEVIDGRVPGGWVISGAEGSFTLGPRRFVESGFWERYFDQDPEAVVAYREEIGSLADGDGSQASITD